MRSLAIFMAISIAGAASAQSYTSGNVRVQVLSPTLIRIEQRGPKGFEDRPTFHVAGRYTWPGARYVTQKGNTAAWLRTPDWVVTIPTNCQSIADVVVSSANAERTPIYKPDGKLTNAVWLPAPGKMPKAWVFADTPRMIPSKVGITPGSEGDPTSGWDVDNDAPDIYVFLPKGDYKKLRADFIKLTGPVEMPPLYALGYTDSRYYAYEQNEALRRIDEYRRRQIPLDTFVIDTDWRLGGSHGYKVDPKYFPDMPGFLKAAHQRHVHTMFNDHPEPQAKGALDPKELQYRFDGLSTLLKQGLDIWWYDRNWYVGIPQPAPNLARETWGMALYHDVTLRTKPNQRPLIMANVDGIDNGFRNRPPNVAAHRYPVQWTGDTRAQWEFLRRGVENAVYEGVMGLNPWVNEDLGGHVGKPDSDLYIRFLQFGSVCPFMRVHSTKGQTREPWVFGTDAEKIVPEYIKMRYRLMPLFYASARAAYENGEPLLRRLDLGYSRFPEAVKDDQFLIGDSLLVAPIVGGKDAEVVPAKAFPEGLRADYFPNKDLSGVSPIHGPEKSIDHDWRAGSPDPHLPNDNFSARWTGKITIPKDHPYRLAITGDDGVRLWIDGKLLVDKWVPQDSVTTEAALDLAPGSTHDIKVEYMELQYNAVCKLRWRPITALSEKSTRTCWIPPGGWVDVWTGKRYTGPSTINVYATLSQMPMFVRDGGIVPLGPEVQWTGQKDWSALTLNLYPGNGNFTLYEDDGNSLGYASGRFRKTPITMNRNGAKTTLKIGAPNGNYPGAIAQRAWTLRVFGDVNSVTVDGKPAKGVRVKKAANQPFRNTGGEPTGNLIEIDIPRSPVGQAHTVEIKG